jgi:hypothetical protein
MMSYKIVAVKWILTFAASTERLEKPKESPGAEPIRIVTLRMVVTDPRSRHTPAGLSESAKLVPTD